MSGGDLAPARQGNLRRKDTQLFSRIHSFPHSKSSYLFLPGLPFHSGKIKRVLLFDSVNIKPAWGFLIFEGGPDFQTAQKANWIGVAENQGIKGRNQDSSQKQELPS